MTDDKKPNTQYFEGGSMRELYSQMEEWERSNRQRLLSVSVQEDKGRFCCTALTNPTEKS